MNVFEVNEIEVNVVWNLLWLKECMLCMVKIVLGICD